MTVTLHNEPGDHPMSPVSGQHVQNVAPFVQTDAAVFYGVDGYTMNDFTRNGEVGPDHSADELRDVINQLDADITAAPTLTDSIVTWRGVTDTSAMRGGGLASSWTDRGYTSTTDSRSAALGYTSGSKSALIRVTTPRGFRAVTITKDPSGGEILLPRNTTFKITDFNVPGQPMRTLGVEVVSQPGVRP